MQFAKFLNSVKENQDVTLSEDWAQGRSAFGGVASGLAFQKAAMALESEHSGIDRPVRSLLVSFVGPVDVTDTIGLTSEVIRSGKSVAQVEARIDQKDETKLVLLAAFGAPRESAIKVTPNNPLSAKPPMECAELPYFEGVTPRFTQHYHYRFNWGGFPFTGNPSREMGGWVKYRQPEPEMTTAHLLGLLDSWPPAVLPMLSKPSPGSSLTWMVDFVHPRPVISPDEWFLYHSEVQEAANGYAMIDSRMWNEKGELLVIGRQCVTVFG